MQSRSDNKSPSFSPPPPHPLLCVCSASALRLRCVGVASAFQLVHLVPSGFRLETLQIPTDLTDPTDPPGLLGVQLEFRLGLAIGPQTPPQDPVGSVGSVGICRVFSWNWWGLAGSSWNSDWTSPLVPRPPPRIRLDQLDQLEFAGFSVGILGLQQGAVGIEPGG